MTLIDKDKAWLIKRLNELRKSCSDSAVPPDKGYYTAKAQAYEKAIELANLLEMPTAVVHGEWIEEDGVQICSKCGEEHEWEDFRAKYCDNCGAKMDGHKKEATP